MSQQIPSRILISHDDRHARHIGRTSDGQQFFLTNPFRPMTKLDAGREFIALYLFDRHGEFHDARIEDMGVRDEMHYDDIKARYYSLLESLGSVTYCAISIAPFYVERFGTTFGLIPREGDDDEDCWVTVEPGDYMAFHAPWDSGEYDT